MAIHEIRVGSIEKDIKGKEVASEARKTIGIAGLEKVKTAKVYRIEGASQKQTKFLAEHLFTDPITQEHTVDDPLITDAKALVEVAYKPGVMNPESASIIKAAKVLGVDLKAADSSTEYGFYGNVAQEQIEQIVNRHLVNKTVERIVTEKPETLIISGEPGLVDTIPIRDASPERLMDLSKDKLFLDVEEMQAIQDYFNGLGRDPTDCELEIIAARWSEHCGHKTLKAKVIADGVEKPPLFTRITETARKYFGDEVLSAFVDNSGVAKFYDGQAVCGKVETHNSPSAIEPYGGAGTGSGGVFRDIIGTGQGAKVVSSTDMFCFAPPNLDPTKLPEGTLHPDYLQRKVVAGVRDYGNRMGIPTNNGSVHYHEDFRAKPTVIVGAYGILPEDKAQKGKPQLNDLVVVIGGRTGRDGIHGATFSSGEMTERTISVKLGGGKPEIVMVNQLKEKEKNLLDYQILALPGGFAYGDDLGAGKILALELDAYLRDQIYEFNQRRDGLVIGICNGFQVLVRTGLLPFGTMGEIKAVLDVNASGRFDCRPIKLKIQEQNACKFLEEVFGTMEFKVAHGEGKFYAPSQTLDKIESQRQVVCSLNAIAGICDPSGRILGLMPHPERSIRKTQYDNWRRMGDFKPEGLQIFENMVSYAKQM